MNYSQRTYFKHLRLYDFVLKNSKTSEKKFIQIPLVVPQMGTGLEHAMTVTDEQTQIWFEDEESGKRSGAKLPVCNLEPIDSEDGLNDKPEHHSKAGESEVD